VRVARQDAPAQPGNLILARFDHQAQQIVSIGQSAQLAEAQRLVLARASAQVVPDGIVELAASRVLTRL
jgi:hypothetical protein